MKATDSNKRPLFSALSRTLLAALLAASLVPASALAEGVSAASSPAAQAAQGDQAAAWTDGAGGADGTGGASADGAGSGFDSSSDLGAAAQGSPQGTLGSGQAGSADEPTVVADGESVSVTFSVELDGKEASDAVTFTDPATGKAVTSLGVAAGGYISVGIEPVNPALHEVKAASWQLVANQDEEFAASLELGNQLVLQDDGTYRSTAPVSANAVVKVSLVERDRSASAVVTGGGQLALANRGEQAAEVHAAAGDEVTVLPQANSGYYLAQVRWAKLPANEEAGEASGSVAEGDTAEGAESDTPDDAGLEADDPLAFTVLQPDESGAYSFIMPEGQVVVYADFVSAVWDGTIDVTWYDPEASSFSIQYAAQFAGLAAIVNGIFTTYPTKTTPIEGSVNTAEIPDYDAFKEGMGVIEEAQGESIVTASSEYYGEFEATYHVALSQGRSSQSEYGRSDAITRTTRVIGNPDYIQLNADEGELTEDSQNLRTSNVYYYGADNFNGKHVDVVADLDFGATKTGGAWDVSSPLYMPLGGQYAMLPGGEGGTNAYSIIGSSWNGVLDGNGHSFRNVFCEYYASGSNYGDSVSIGLVGRMGNHDDEKSQALPCDPTVRQIVFESGYVSGRRSVGGIVGKIGHTTASKDKDGSTGGIVEYCVNYADIQTTDKKGVGGIVGAAYNAGVIRYCANFGSVTSLLGGGTNAGGIAGLSELLILNCYNAGTVSAKADSFSCAITTNNGGAAVTNCYWLAGSAKGEACYNSNKTDTIYEFGEGAKIAKLTADLLNAGSSKVWVDVKDSDYPALYYQVAGYDPTDAYTVTVEQPKEGGTISATPLKGGFADTVNLSCEPEPGYVLDYYTLNGQRLATSSFGLDGNATVSAKFRQKKTVTALVTKRNEEYGTTLTVTKKGVAPDADTGELKYVEDYLVNDGDTLYEGDELFYQVELDEGAAPENPSLEYTGTFRVYNYSVDEKLVYWRSVYPDMCYTYTVSGKEAVSSKTLQISVEEAFTDTRSWQRKADTSWFDAEDPQESYSISTAEQLAGVAKLVNDGTTTFEGITLTLAGNISLADYNGKVGENGRMWQPIGQTGKSFEGTFDGAGFTVSDMEMSDGDADNRGLFGNVKNAVVKNVTVEGSVCGSSYVAGVVGYAKASRIENCVNRAFLTAAYRYAGGIVGVADGATTVANCRNEGQVIGMGSASVEYVGGIAGAVQAGSMVQGCTNEAAVSLANAEKGMKVGGVAGAVSNSKVENCLNKGAVTGSEYAGPPVGYAGGIAGVLSSGGSISGCANLGDVEGKRLRAGGVVGQLDQAGSVLDCYNRGSVSVEKAVYAGGLVACIGPNSTGELALSNCYNDSFVEGGYCGAVAGVVNGVKATASNVHYNAQLCSKDVYAEVSKGSLSGSVTKHDTAADMKDLAATLNGESGKTWKDDGLNANGGLPLLAWQLPYDVVFYDSLGNELLRVGIPEGYDATVADVAKLAPEGTQAEANVPEGYTSTFAFWASELNGKDALTINGASVDVQAWPSFAHEAITYSITYDLNGGQGAEGNPASYTVEDSIELAKPERQGFRFTYWSDAQGNVVTRVGKDGVLGDLQLKANWSDSETCVVTYPATDGTMQALVLKVGAQLSVQDEETVTVEYDIAVPEPKAEPEEGYRKVGYKASVSPDGNVVRLTRASYDPIPYAISYDAAGGTLPAGAASSFTVESQLSLPKAQREGYVFLGWYDASEKKWEAVPRGTKGDLSLTAKWARDLSCAQVSGLKASYEYTGEAITPKLTVKHDGTELRQGADYEVTYRNNIEVGKATVSIEPVGGEVSGTWTATFEITTPQLTDSETGITLTGKDLLNLREPVGDEQVDVKLNASFFSYARVSELRTLFSNLGYKYHVGASVSLEITRTYPDGTRAVRAISDGGVVAEQVTDGFGSLLLSVPVSADDGTLVAAYWMDGTNAELVQRATVENGRVSFTVDTLGDFAIVSRMTASDIIDDKLNEGTAENAKKDGVAVVAEGSGSGSNVTATAKSEASEDEKTSGAGTVDAASKAKGSSSTTAADGARSAASTGCDGCFWCSVLPFEGACSDLCSADDPCPWCSSAPLVALLVLGGAGVAAWALFMRFRRKPKEDFTY